MPELFIRIRGNTASAEGDPLIICGNSDYTAAFRFDTDWDAADQQAHFSFFRGGVQQMLSVPFTGDVCAVPVLRGIREVEIGVSAGNRRTSTPARIPCAVSITCLPAADCPPQSDLYDELAEAVAAKTPFSRRYALRDADGYAVRDADGFAVTVKG